MSNNATQEANTKRKYQKSELTPAKKKFAEEFAATDNATEAVRRAYPKLVETSSPEYMSLKGNRLLRNDSVTREISYQRDKLERLASKAVDRIDRLISSENEQVATTNAWKTVEQVHGKATQRLETQTNRVSININLNQSQDSTDTD